MSLRLVTPPDGFPVTAAEAKAACRVLHDDEDGYFDLLIAAATDHVERFTGRAILPQTWEMVLDAFSDAILIPRGPVTEIEAISYFDSDEAEQTVSTSTYVLDDVSDPQWVVRGSAYSWPVVADGVNNVTIRFVAGYETMPAALKQAILLLVAHWYRNREAASDKAMAEMPHSVEALLVNFRSFA